MTLLLSSTTQAYFQDAAYGARPAGMGEAFVSVADDINAVLFNPAGLAQLPGLEIMGMYADLYSGLNTRLYTEEKDSSGYHFLAAASPWPLIHGSLSAYWLRYASLVYSENTFALGYSRRLLAAKAWPRGVSLDGGINLKLLQWSVAANEYTSNTWLFPERQKIGVSLDLGLRAILFDNLYLGFAIDNLIPPDMGLTVREYVPSIFRLGVAYHLPFSHPYIDDLLTQCELSARDNIYTTKLGMESWLIRRIFALRAGISTDSLTSGLSLRYGLPGRPLAVQLDYAYTYPFYLADTWGSHRLSLTASWEIDNVLPAEESVLPASNPTPNATATVEVGQDPDYEKFLKFLQFQKYQETQAVGSSGTTSPAAASVPVKKQTVPIQYFQEDTIILALENNVLTDRWSIQEAMSKAESLLKYFRGKTQSKLTLQRFARTDELQKTLAQGQADLVIGAAGVLKKWEKQNLVRPLVTCSKQNNVGDFLVLCSRDGEKILYPSDCKGLRLGYVHGENLNDVKRLFYADLKPQEWSSFFRSSQQYPSTRACFIALQMKEIDVMVSWLALYESYREQEANMIQSVRIVARAQTMIPSAPVCIRTTISPAKLKAVHSLYQQALRMHNDPEGRAALLSLGFDRVVPAPPSSD